MAAPTLTYSLTNGTTADATQVMQNYNDILNGITDGTKDLTFNALTTNGTANLKANTTIGASSANTLTLTASLASNVVPSADNTYDLGSSTLGMRSAYFGANSHRVRVLGSATMSANWTLTLPVTAGSAYGYLITDGSGVSSWQALASGTAGTDFAISNAAGTTTFNLPDAGASARGLVTSGSQTFGGTKTFSGVILSGSTGTLNSFTDVTSVAYASGDYTASGGGSVTTLVGEMTTFRYAIINKLMWVWFELSGFTVAGTVTAVNVKIPASASTPYEMRLPGVLFDNSGTVQQACEVYIAPSGGTTFSFRKFGGNFAASTTNSVISCGICFPIN